MTTNNFTWNVQKAGYDFDQKDLKGNINFQGFITEFEQFPWLDELKRVKEYPDKVSPTISVVDEKENRIFWVSIAGNQKEYEFIIGYIYPKKKRTFFGFGKEKKIKWLDMFTTKDTELIKSFFRLQFDREYEKLFSKLNQLDKFGETEVNE